MGTENAPKNLAEIVSRLVTAERSVEASEAAQRESAEYVSELERENVALRRKSERDDAYVKLALDVANARDAYVMALRLLRDA